MKVFSIETTALLDRKNSVIMNFEMNVFIYEKLCR